MPSVRITRGRFTALWLVLRTLAKLGGHAEGAEVLAYARRSSLRAGGLPIRDGYRLAQEGSFVTESVGRLALGELGKRALDLSDDDEPPAEAVRLFMSVLMLRDPPSWVSWWQGSPDDLDLVIPEDELLVMHDAGLLPTPDAALDPLGWAWWNALSRVPLPEQTAMQRKQIGEAGEQLTLDYERIRLTDQGYPDLAANVRWVAQESAAYGFDVLSFAGDGYGGDPRATLAIEVKSSSVPLTQHFSFFLTAHEWDTAICLEDRYILHLWGSVDPGPPPASRSARPIVVSPNALRHHLPRAPICGESCSWHTARVKLPLAS